MLHVTTTVSLKQGETRTNSVPIPHPLNSIIIVVKLVSLLNEFPALAMYFSIDNGEPPKKMCYLNLWCFIVYII